MVLQVATSTFEPTTTKFVNEHSTIHKLVKASSLLVIKQKGKSQNGYSKTKHAKFSEKRTFLTP